MRARLSPAPVWFTNENGRATMGQVGERYRECRDIWKDYNHRQEFEHKRMQLGHLKRREFIILLGSAAAWPRVVRGQSKPAIIGVLGSGSAQSSAFLIGALKEGMKENGLAEGRDYELDVRWAEGDYTRFATLAFELLDRKSSRNDLTTNAPAAAGTPVTTATPIGQAGVLDPIKVGLNASLARPGNNTTGISNMIQDMSAKGLELIREVAPTSKTVAALFN